MSKRKPGQPLESTIQKGITAYLDKRPYCWYTKIHGGAYQKKGLPDLIGCDNGRFFGIELKRPGEKPTALQSQRIIEIGKAGGIAGVATSIVEVINLLGPVAEPKS